MNPVHAAGWTDLFVGTLGASAALAGLVFVGMSINLERIVALPGTPERGLESILLLFGVLAMSTMALIPQDARALGIELLVAGVIEWALLVVLNAAQWRRLDRRFRVNLLVHAGLGQASAALFAAAGLTLLLGTGGGLYLTAPAVIVSFGAAIYNTWVLLVEILR